MTGEVVLALRQAGVSYKGKGRDDFWALRDVTFDVKRGETLGIVGRNGAGKSTLMRLLCGIYAPDEGHVEHYENSASLLSLRVGMVPHLSGRQNAILSAMFLGVPKKKILEAMDEIIEFTGLEEFIDMPLRTYSSGMKARLGFGVGFYADPDILLIDEVMGVGDFEFRQKSKLAMRQKIASDKTVVMVSHQAAAIRDMCDRVVWLDKGRVQEVGDPDEVLENYLEANMARREENRKKRNALKRKLEKDLDEEPLSGT